MDDLPRIPAIAWLFSFLECTTFDHKYLTVMMDGCFKISMCPFERILLQELSALQPALRNHSQTVCEEQDPKTLRHTAFHHWEWTYRIEHEVEAQLQGGQEDDQIHLDLLGAYKEFLHTIANYEPMARHLSRSQNLERENTDFAGFLGRGISLEISVVPCITDLTAWSELVAMYINGAFTFLKPNKLSLEHGPVYARSTFEIWKIVRTYYLTSGIMSNVSEGYTLLFEHPAFTRLWALQVLDPSECGLMEAERSESQSSDANESGGNGEVGGCVVFELVDVQKQATRTLVRQTNMLDCVKAYIVMLFSGQKKSPGRMQTVIGPKITLSVCTLILICYQLMPFM